MCEFRHSETDSPPFHSDFVALFCYFKCYYGRIYSVHSNSVIAAEYKAEREREAKQEYNLCLCVYMCVFQRAVFFLFTLLSDILYRSMHIAYACMYIHVSLMLSSYKYSMFIT